MSFTRQVKQELVHLEDRAPCCRAWELSALLLLRGKLEGGLDPPLLTIRVDYNVLARHLYTLLKNAGIDSPAVQRREKKRLGKDRYLVRVCGAEQVAALLLFLQLEADGSSGLLRRTCPSTPYRRCCRRAFVRGAFLAAGTVNVSGRSGYHLEISSSRRDDMRTLQEVLQSFSLRPIMRTHNQSCSLYLKSAEAIADLLRIIGANGALLQMENMRVFKSMRNQVNRLVNCDTANLDKIVASARQQLDLIDQIEVGIGLENLPPALRQAARLRRSHPEASLKELGEMLTPPVGKSGMNHRFRQLARIARECAGEKG